MDLKALDFALFKVLEISEPRNSNTFLEKKYVRIVFLKWNTFKDFKGEILGLLFNLFQNFS